MTSATQLYGRWLILAHYAWYACAFFAAVVLLGSLPVYFSHLVPLVRSDAYSAGQLMPPLQVLVQVSEVASSLVSFALGVLLFWRKPNDRMALFASFFLLMTSVVWSHSLDYFLGAYFGAPATYDLWSDFSIPFAILLFCIFPDGRFVPRWTRWLFLLSIPLPLASAFSILARAEAFAISGALTYPLFFLAAYAQVYRYRRVSSYAERQQTKWWIFGVVLSLVLALLASLIYQTLSAPLLNVTPIFFTVAIVRSHLWDIDIIIRKTLIYTILTGLVVGIYLSSVILLQQLFSAVTGSAQNELVTVISTLGIAALFVPLRSRVQNLIDRRFYRNKYDAQQVLNSFNATMRDETDMEKLTASLVGVVQDTMQPTQLSVWLKADAGQGKRE